MLLPWLGTVAVARYCGLVLASCLGIGLVLALWLGTATGKMTRYRCCDTVLVPSLGTGLVVRYWHGGSVVRPGLVVTTFN